MEEAGARDGSDEIRSAGIGAGLAERVRTVIAQDPLRSMKVNNEEYDFTEPARRLLESSNVFDPLYFYELESLPELTLRGPIKQVTN